jgi:hypothetical protein
MLGIDLAYAQVAAALPAPEADALRMQQAAWAQGIADMCDVDSAATRGRDIGDSPSLCLAGHFQEWGKWLEGYHRRIGRFDIVGRSITQWSRRQYYEVRIHYPQLSNPMGRGEQAFNEWAAADARSYARYLDVLELARSDGVSDEHKKAFPPSLLSRDYRIVSADDGLISVIWDDYVYGTGAAHGTPSTEGALFSLGAARPLGAADVFAADVDWVERATDLCMPQLTAKIPDKETGLTPETVGDVVAEFTSWSFGPEGATITFDVYTIASYASGVTECKLSYEVLRPMLNPTLSFRHG